MTLDPIAQKMIDETRASGRPNAHLLTIEAARQRFEDAFEALEKPEVHDVVDFRIPTRDGQIIPARLYIPDGQAQLPLTIYFHGGGWLLGSINSHDVATRRLALASGSAVLSVDYRRGPESRFPTAFNDAIDALQWALSPDAQLPVDASRVAVAGDSAGGNLAAALAHYARDSETVRLRHQLLVYPVTTCDLTIGFDSEFDGIMLERDEMQWHQDNYLPSSDDARDPRVDVLSADLAGLAETTIILAECDPVRPQGRLYATALRAAGVPVEVHQTAGMVHGFFGLDEVFPAATEAMEFAGARLRQALDAELVK